jgi:hypothetical protein
MAQLRSNGLCAASKSCIALLLSIIGVRLLTITHRHYAARLVLTAFKVPVKRSDRSHEVQTMLEVEREAAAERCVKSSGSRGAKRAKSKSKEEEERRRARRPNLGHLKAHVTSCKASLPQCCMLGILSQ